MKILKKLEESLNKELPFVIYKKPNEEELKGFFQKNNKIYKSNSYVESGFIFAPFNNEDSSILMPSFDADYLKEKISLKIEDKVSKWRNNKEENLEAYSKHIKLVNKGVEVIKKGLLKKVVLSRKEVISLKDISIIETFKQLLNNYPSAFVYVWCHPKVGVWIGATPETLLATKENNFKTMSLAGTLSAKGNKNVVWGEKELVEQRMVTDYLVENIKTITKDYKVSELETYQIGELFHLRTKVSGSYKGSIFDLIALLHPTPAVCGFPKLEAKEFILKNEFYKRKFYTGFLGELNLEGEVSNLYVNLRCMEIDKEKGVIYVGGGITKDSSSEKEWEETISKSYAIKNNLN